MQSEEDILNLTLNQKEVAETKQDFICCWCSDKSENMSYYKCMQHSNIFCYACLACGTVDRKEAEYPKCKQKPAERTECIFNKVYVAKELDIVKKKPRANIMLGFQQEV